MPKEVYDILIKFALSLVLSGVIGIEREINQRTAGIKTHILVGLSATLIAIIQLDVIDLVTSLNSDLVRVDPVRLIAQVVSGIGFLGAGAIVVTKRTVSGLTTAASIWSVAAIGLAIGMGFYASGIIGSLFVIGSLVFFKRVHILNVPETLVVKYVGGEVSQHKLYDLFHSLNLDVETTRLTMNHYGNDLIATHVFKVKMPRHFKFEALVQAMLKTKFVMSVERSNIE